VYIFSFSFDIVADLADKRIVSENTCIELAKEYNIPYIEVSANDGTNVDKLFSSLAALVLERTITTERRTKAYFS
jgi:nitrogenase molybdenum-iron protein alpha/beta subunit